MEAKEYRTIDKSIWPAGEWSDEPDKVQWPDATTGLPCLAVRHERMGFWCGYVGVSEGHRLFGKGYSETDNGAEYFEVHGGLTFADSCQSRNDEARGICHVPATGESDKVWWFGFDCGHAGDYSPSDAERAREGGIWALFPDDKYRTLAYVRHECTNLAKQLAAA